MDVSDSLTARVRRATVVAALGRTDDDTADGADQPVSRLFRLFRLLKLILTVVATALTIARTLGWL